MHSLQQALSNQGLSPEAGPAATGTKEERALAGVSPDN